MPPSLSSNRVASFTDAWIETKPESTEKKLEASHLLQMRGLKPLRTLWKDYMDFVASFTDAWIETHSEPFVAVMRGVASFTDAWIETSRVAR